MGKPEISTKAVDQDRKDRTVELMNSEDKSIREGTIWYDLRFKVKIPKMNEVVELLLNIEIQLTAKLNYKIVTRGIYYCSRMISAQKNTEFKGDEYQNIKKVVSIWLCPHNPMIEEKNPNTITKYEFNETQVCGKYSVPKDAYDKMEVIIVTLSGDTEDSEKEILRMMNIIFFR